LENIKTHPRFIISGVTMNWSDEILSCIDIAFWVQTPLEERLKRIQAREENRFGAMFTQQMEFRKVVENRDSKAVEECAMKLGCPVIVIDGTLSAIHNLEKIIDNFNQLL
jgi:thymidylate kinase